MKLTATLLSRFSEGLDVVVELLHKAGVGYDAIPLLLACLAAGTFALSVALMTRHRTKSAYVRRAGYRH